MQASNLDLKLKLYYFIALTSFLFALLGFSYNAWRLEETEANNNIRTASFEVLQQLALLEQIIYAAHYDQDATAGNPRLGWVKVGLIHDLSDFIAPNVALQAETLKSIWSQHWNQIDRDRLKVNQIITEIDAVRAAIRVTLKQLK